MIKYKGKSDRPGLKLYLTLFFFQKFDDVGVIIMQKFYKASQKKKEIK